MVKIMIHCLVFLLLFCSKTFAQTINTGDMSILNGTVVSTISNFSNAQDATLINDGEFFVFADFNNDGLVDFTPSQKGYTRFEGNSLQIISGTSPAEFTKFYNVLFDNNSVQPAFHLSGDISISGSSDFNRGIVQNDDFAGLIVYENDGSHVNTSNESHVDGYVQKNGTSEFLYPTGDSGFFRYAKVIPITPNAPNDAFTGKYFLQNSNLLYPHSNRSPNLLQIDNTEYWTIDKTNGDSKIMLTLSWDQATTPNFIWSDLDPNAENETVSIARWDEVQKLWVDLEGIVEIGGNGISSGSVTTFSNTGGFGVFTLAKVKRKVEEGNLVVFNAVSPNGDGKNDYFTIDKIENYPNNHVEIYNQWGVKVFETSNYNSNGNVFKGYSHGRTTISPKDKLPTGTYYYILTYEVTKEGSSKNIEKAGFLYLNDN